MREGPQVELLQRAAEVLRPILPQLTFVGAATLVLLIDDTATPPPRPTIDIDVVVDSITRIEYYEIESQMRQLGFSQSDSEPIVCRWTGHGIIVDVMPSDASILGFSNRWYPSGIENSVNVTLPNGASIRCLDGPHFLATKLEALRGRGKDDVMASHDFEDVVALVDGRTMLFEEVEASPTDIKHFVSERIRQMRELAFWRDALEGALGGHLVSSDRATIVDSRFNRLASASLD